MRIYYRVTLLLGLLIINAHAASNSTNSKPLAGIAIASNPSAVDTLAGNGALQSYLENKFGIKNNHGIRFGGNLIFDTNSVFSGGIHDAKRSTNNGLLVLDASLDTEKALGWQGGLFDVQFLQFNGQSTNKQAGTVQGYNSLPGESPLNRSELYQLWYQQLLFNNKLIVHIGKLVPTFEFGNVIKPVSLRDGEVQIPAVTGLIFTPLFVNATMLGVMPGYYNSAYGLTVTLKPFKQAYFSYGIYNGALAQGKQTGLTGPIFDGTYFNIGEIGWDWLLGKNNMPGTLAVGTWHQSGLIDNNAGLEEQGASGYYLFGSQRLWYRHPFQDNSGVSSFIQYGKNNSDVLSMNEYIGMGLTAFGLVADRLDDSMGAGLALSWLNQHSFSRRTELLYQAYYQAKLMNGLYAEPVISYIPTPGAEADLPATWAGTLRFIILF